METGKSEEESNMAVPMVDGKDIDQDQKKGEEEETNVLETREAKELFIQLVKKRISDSHTKNTSAQ